MRQALFSAAILASLIAPASIGCTGSAAEETPNKEFKVALHDQAPYFDPRRLRVARGTTVTWENHGPALTHTIFFVDDSGAVHSGPLRPKESWSYTFKNDAVIKVSCEVHPYMYGIVIAGDPSATLIQAVESSEDTRSADAVAGRMLEFPLPVPNAVPGILSVDAEDNIWVTLGGGGWGNIDLPPLNKFARLTIDGDISIFSTPTSDSGPSGLLIAPTGEIFITELMAGKVARFLPRKRLIEEFSVPTSAAWPTGLALARDGALWFNETKGNKVATLLPNGRIKELPVPTDGAHPTGMAIGPDDAIWIAERDQGKLARIAKDGSVVEFLLPTPKAKPAGVTVDSRGRVWTAERAGNNLAAFEHGKVREYPLPKANSGPFFVLPDRDDNIWFSEVFGNRISVLIPETGEIFEFRVPSPDAWPGGLAFDSQGNLWFTEQLANKIGVLLNAPGALAETRAKRSALGRSAAEMHDAAIHQQHQNHGGQQ
jgi:streptogramin lyase